MNMPKIVPSAAPAVGGVDISTPLSASKDYSRFAGSSRVSALKGDIVSIGPPGEGKSIFAASGSEYYPPAAEIERRFKGVRRWALSNYAGPPPAFASVELSDLAWLAADTAPLAGLNELGIQVPTVIDLQAIALTYGPIKTVFLMDEILNDLLRNRPLRFLVFDTVSSFDKELVPAIMARYDNDPKQNVRIWTDVANAHRKLRASFKSAVQNRGGNLHTIAHGKAVGDAATMADGNQWKEMAVLNQEAAGKEPISADITGKSANLYKGHSNFQFVIKREDVKAKAAAEEIKDPTIPRWWAYRKTGEWETKSRFMAALPEKMPADLRHIFSVLASVTQVMQEHPVTSQQRREHASFREDSFREDHAADAAHSAAMLMVDGE
jgi:hypothetical protein